MVEHGGIGEHYHLSPGGQPIASLAREVDDLSEIWMYSGFAIAREGYGIEPFPLVGHPL